MEIAELDGSKGVAGCQGKVDLRGRGSEKLDKIVGLIQGHQLEAQTKCVC